METARLELHNPLAQAGSNSYLRAGLMHTDACVHIEPAASIAFLSHFLHRHHITLFTRSTQYTGLTPDYALTMHSQSSRQSAIHQDVHTSQKF